MKNILELKEKRKALRDQALEVMNKAETEKRSMSADELEKYENIDADIDNMTREIAAVEKMTEALRTAGETDPERIKEPESQKDTRENPVNTKEYRSAYDSYLRFGAAGLTPEERKIIEAGKQQLNGNEARALSAVTGSAGGYTVPQGFFNELETAMKAFGGMRNISRVIKTASGNDLPMPSVNDTSNMGELVGENTAVTAQDIAFGQIIMKAYKYSSKTVLIPIELLQDSAINVEEEAKNLLAERLYRITNLHYTTGDNTGKPQGIITGATLGKTGTTGQTTSIVYDDLVDLVHSIDPAYRQKETCGFMFNDSTLKALKKLKDGQQRPLWVPGIAEREPDTILGHKYNINQDMPVMAASAKSILFGDMYKYIIRDVLDVMIVRISEKYIESGQIGFLCFYRTDGRMRDAGGNPIKYYQNSAT